MKVYEMIEKLNKYNKNANVTICVNGMPKEFEICYGGGDGCTPASCKSVDFMIDTPNEQF